MNYRPEIDGLRALAVVPVIFFHAGFNFFSGGFIGVDIFFVISGYLITNIILADINGRKFSIIAFYERRVRRILPALFLVMVACIPFAWILLNPFDLTSFSKSLIAVPLFLSNLFFWKDGGYFEMAAELKPLLHTWSLAVEEQYYIFFPAFLILVYRFGRRHAIYAILLITVLSLAASQFGSIYRPVANFFLLPTRSWELGIGALSAFYIAKENLRPASSLTREILSSLGLFSIGISIFLFNKETPSPSFYILLPTLGTALILLFGLFDTWTGKLLSSKLLVCIGLISYSAYLWHQPIFAFSRFYFSSQQDILILSLIVIIFLLSFISWRYVERPFRNQNLFSRKFIFIFSIAGSILFIIFGYSSYKLFGSTSIYGAEAKMAKALSTVNAIYVSNMDERRFVKFRIEYETLSPKAIVLGSSRIMQIGANNYEKNTLNLGVSGASIEDDIAIANMAVNKFKPTTIFIAADPWLFNSKSKQLGWKSISDDYLIALSKLQNSTAISQSSIESNETLFSTLASRIYDEINIQSYKAYDDSPGPRDKIRRDGSRVYNTARNGVTQKEIDLGASEVLDYAMGDYGYSSASEAIFRRYLNDYSKKYRVVLILPPFHPSVYDLMRNDRPIFVKIENDYREIAKNNGIEIIGSYDPKKVGCDSSEFYDGMHPKGVCMDKVLRQLKNTK